MRCGKCGNENASGNRFCGMCGSALLEKPAAAPAGPSPLREAWPSGSAAGASRSVAPRLQPTARESEQLPQAAPSHTSQQLSSLSMADDEPTIAGPSFLGLNKPSNRPAANDSYNPHDPLRTSSGSLDYLLEDDEEEPKRGWGKVILAVVALALAMGFGYLHWKQGGFDWLNGDKKSAVQPSSDIAPSSAESAVSAQNSSAIPQAAAPQSTAQQSTPGADATPSANSGGAPASVANSAPPQPAASQNPSPDASAQTAVPGPSANSPPTSSQNVPAQTETSGAKKSAEPPAGETQTGNSQADDSQENASEDQASAETAPSPKPATRKPPSAKAIAKPTPVKPVDTVAEAERYIYGRGVPQDCDHGLRLLKPAAAESSPAAMISLGALYSTGTCTPRDLPTAYRWFALALHKQPDNQRLQDDLQKLWSQMTQPERQLAIKLSQ